MSLDTLLTWAGYVAMVPPVILILALAYEFFQRPRVFPGFVDDSYDDLPSNVVPFPEREREIRSLQQLQARAK